MKNYYSILGIRFLDFESLDLILLKKILRILPEKNPSEFQINKYFELFEAYEVLSNDYVRMKYNTFLVQLNNNDIESIIRNFEEYPDNELCRDVKLKEVPKELRALFNQTNEIISEIVPKTNKANMIAYKVLVYYGFILKSNGLNQLKEAFLISGLISILFGIFFYFRDHAFAFLIVGVILLALSNSGFYQNHKQSSRELELNKFLKSRRKYLI
jgi:hypothetical protein